MFGPEEVSPRRGLTHLEQGREIATSSGPTRMVRTRIETAVAMSIAVSKLGIRDRRRQLAEILSNEYTSALAAGHRFPKRSVRLVIPLGGRSQWMPSGSRGR